MVSKSRFKNILALKHKKFRDAQKLFLIEGYHLCQEALHSSFIVETLLINPDCLTPQKLDELVLLAQHKNTEIIEIQPSEVSRLALTVHSQGIFCIVQQLKFELETLLNKLPSFILIIDKGQDPGNVGTVIRTCDWFGVDAVLLSKSTVELYNPKLVRSTMGSIFHVPIIPELDLTRLLPQLRRQGFSIFGADLAGEYLYHQIDYPRPLALIIGNENRGIGEEYKPLLDKTIAIPSQGKAESLNMALAAAIIISRIIH